MTQSIIGFFCGTGLKTNTDASLGCIHNAVKPSVVTLLAYDGCQVHGGGLFSYGVEEQADAFINDLKQQLHPDETHYQINLVAHSRGVLSALLAIKKIQADPALRDKVSITADFHDPVPGNLQITTKIASDWTSANQVRDLSHCDIVKKVSITLQEAPIGPIAFDMLVSKFHHATALEIETIPGYHDVQHRQWLMPDVEHKGLFRLGIAKTLSILKADGVALKAHLDTDFNALQIYWYTKIMYWAKTRETPFGERDIHFGGKIIANNHVREEIDAVNWRHAQLLGTTPHRVLYGTTQPDYNYKKTLLEHTCDVMQTLNSFAINNPDHMDLATAIQQKTRAFSMDIISVSQYQNACSTLLKESAVNDATINKAINYLCMANYFAEFDKAIETYITPDDSLFNNLQVMKVRLQEELTVEIESGKSIDRLQSESSAVKIANNTAIYLRDICEHATSPEEIIQISENYANENIRLGRNWHLGAKIIAGVIIVLATAIMGCAIGATIGFGIGFGIAFTCGIWPGAFLTALTCGTVGSIAGFFAGLKIGSCTINHFFKASPAEQQIQSLVDTVKTGVIAQYNEILLPEPAAFSS